jgi:hypothetical protein
MNLLAETLEALARAQKGPADVHQVVIHPGYVVSWAQFAAVAAQCEYDEDIGDEVMPALKVRGDTWWLERESYDDYLHHDWVLRQLPVEQHFNAVKPLKPADLVWWAEKE